MSRPGRYLQRFIDWYLHRTIYISTLSTGLLSLGGVPLVPGRCQSPRHCLPTGQHQHYWVDISTLLTSDLYNDNVKSVLSYLSRWCVTVAEAICFVAPSGGQFLIKKRQQDILLHCSCCVGQGVSVYLSPGCRRRTCRCSSTGRVLRITGARCGARPSTPPCRCRPSRTRSCSTSTVSTHILSTRAIGVFRVMASAEI